MTTSASPYGATTILTSTANTISPNYSYSYIRSPYYRDSAYQPMTIIDTDSPYVLYNSIGTPLSPLASTPLVSISPSIATYSAASDTVTVVTPINSGYYIRPRYADIDTGLDNSSVVQKDITKYFRFKMLDKWIYSEFSEVLKYLKVSGNKVDLVKSENEKNNNKLSNDSTHDLELKSDYIAENILTEYKTKRILMKIMAELNIKWYTLPQREDLVKEVMGKYLKKKFRKML